MFYVHKGDSGMNNAQYLSKMIIYIKVEINIKKNKNICMCYHVKISMHKIFITEWHTHMDVYDHRICVVIIRVMKRTNNNRKWVCVKDGDELYVGS
jgi:hypothetical protein